VQGFFAEKIIFTIKRNFSVCYHHFITKKVIIIYNK
jgi:hypothetical protein